MLSLQDRLLGIAMVVAQVAVVVVSFVFIRVFLELYGSKYIGDFIVSYFTMLTHDKQLSTNSDPE